MYGVEGATIAGAIPLLGKPLGLAVKYGVGNPLGLEGTISDGIISGMREFKDFSILQISAPISPGNSGGPVFNLNGKLVGVSFASIDKAKVFKEQGVLPSDMGLAIKSDMIQEVFKHKRSIPIKSVKFNKASLYEKMLPSVVIGGALLEDQ